MTILGEIACLIRSKNAGPFELTFDIMFDSEASFERVRRSGQVSKELVARLYNVAPEKVRFFVVPEAMAFKASIPRPFVQGDLRDADGHGGQQYGPLVNVEID